MDKSQIELNSSTKHEIEKAAANAAIALIQSATQAAIHTIEMATAGTNAVIASSHGAVCQKINPPPNQQEETKEAKPAT